MTMYSLVKKLNANWLGIIIKIINQYFLFFFFRIRLTPVINELANMIALPYEESTFLLEYDRELYSTQPLTHGPANEASFQGSSAQITSPAPVGMSI